MPPERCVTHVSGTDIKRMAPQVGLEAYLEGQNNSHFSVARLVPNMGIIGPSSHFFLPPRRKGGGECASNLTRLPEEQFPPRMQHPRRRVGPVLPYRQSYFREGAYMRRPNSTIVRRYR